MKNNEIVVSVICLAYNHEKYIEKTLNEFTKQKTNFKFEVLVHDDASTDKTTVIIKKYEKKYPDIIKPIYQKNNQFSIGNNPTKICFKKAKGKYIALCEGDDYWCDENKLQKQYDFMEKNQDFSACFHNTVKHDLLGIQKDSKFNNWNDIHIMDEKDVFFGWLVHTSSYFVRRECFYKPDQFDKYWFGDYILLTLFFFRGKLAVLPDVMSVYNFNNKNGLTYEVYNKEEIKPILDKTELRKQYLIDYNKYTNNQYEKTVNERIKEIEMSLIIIQLDKGLPEKNDFCKLKTKLLNNSFYKNGIEIKEKIKFKLKYLNYSSYLLYKKIKKVKNNE